MKVSSSASYTKLLLRTDGDSECWRSDDRAEIVRFVHECQFRPLTPESELDLSHGWVSPIDPLNTEPGIFAIETGEYLTLSMRIDCWALPAKLLKARCAARERLYLDEHNKRKLFRSEKLAIKETVTRELRQSSVPKMDVVSVVVAASRGEVYIFSKSKRVLELVESLLEATLDCRCVPMTPLSRAAEAGYEIGAESPLHGRIPTTFFSLEDA